MNAPMDAVALFRTVLANPDDLTPRLVFADWLEDTGEPHNVAWAGYLRRRTQFRESVVELPGLDERESSIRARFTLPARQFVRHFALVLQLLPSRNIRVRLDDFRPSPAVAEQLPISFAIEMKLVPLACEGNAFVLATPSPTDREVREKLEFCLNRDIVLVRTNLDDLFACIERHYGNLNDYESIDS